MQWLVRAEWMWRGAYHGAPSAKSREFRMQHAPLDACSHSLHASSQPGNYANGKFTSHFISAAMKIQFQNNFPFHPWAQLFHCAPATSYFLRDFRWTHQTVFQLEDLHATLSLCFNHLIHPKIASTLGQRTSEHSIPYRVCLCRRDINFILWTRTRTWRLKCSKNIFSKNVFMHRDASAAARDDEFSFLATCAHHIDENISNGFSIVSISSGLWLNQYLLDSVSDFEGVARA